MYDCGTALTGVCTPQRFDKYEYFCVYIDSVVCAYRMFQNGIYAEFYK